MNSGREFSKNPALKSSSISSFGGKTLLSVGMLLLSCCWDLSLFEELPNPGNSKSLNENGDRLGSLKESYIKMRLSRPTI